MNCAIRHLKSKKELDQAYPEHEDGGDEAENCDEVTKFFEDDDLEIIYDDDILIQLFHLSKEKFTSCVIGELKARNKTDKYLKEMVLRFEGQPSYNNLKYENNYDDENVESFKPECFIGDNFIKTDNLMFKKAQCLIISDLDRARVLSCARVSLRDEANANEIAATGALPELMKPANVTSQLENILKCYEGNFFPLPKEDTKEINCMVRHLKGKKMLEENFNPGIEQSQESENCDEYLETLEDPFYEVWLDEWVVVEQNQSPKYINEPDVHKKYLKCRRDMLKLRGYADLKLKEKLFDMLQLPSSLLKKEQQRNLASSRQPCEIEKYFDLAFYIKIIAIRTTQTISIIASESLPLTTA